MKRKSGSRIISQCRIAFGKGRALSAGGAEYSSPGRKPGVTSSSIICLARESGRQNSKGNRVPACNQTSRSSVAPAGLCSAARLRGLVEAFLPARQDFLRLLNTFAVSIAVVAIACSTLELRVMAEKSRGMSSPDTTVLLPNRSPLVSFRIMFMDGSAADLPGKEGLASLTAAMLAEGGSRAKTYSEITDAMYPMATSFQWQVDKEMTVFSGSTHIDNLDKYYALIREMLLDPGFRSDDFKRLKEDAINYLKTSLRGGNDEELGKEVLYTMIYPSTHPYGHQNRGAIGALEKMTVKDVRDFYQNNFTQANLVVGIGRRISSEFPEAGQLRTFRSCQPARSINSK